MRRRRKDFGRAKLLAILFLAVVFAVPYVLNANAANELGSFEAGETGIKLCAVINNGNEDYLRFYVSSNQGFSSDVLVQHNTCRRIPTVAATYTIRQYVPQEYTLTSVTGGTISADNASFVATATGQYTIIHTDTYTKKNFLKAYGYSSTNTVASAVEVRFNANGGTGTMTPQRYGLNASQPLDANTFEYTGYNFTGWNTKADGTGTPYTDEQSVSFATGGILELFAQWEVAPTANSLVSMMAAATNGLDTGVVFGQAASVSGGNGNGINTFSGTDADGGSEPIYYFRGEVDNNNVVWADYCWKILRTTSNGGVKMIYNGAPTIDGSNITCDGATEYIGDARAQFNTQQDYVETIGYMKGSGQTGYEYVSTTTSTSMIFSNDVTWNGSSYTLTNRTTGTWASNKDNIANGHFYFCENFAYSCNEVYYLINPDEYSSGNLLLFFARMKNGRKLETIEAYDNTVDSSAKNLIDSWFSENIPSTKRTELEDTVFCNDRRAVYGTLASKDANIKQSDGSYHFYSEYAAYARNSGSNQQPSLECPLKRDAFTVNETSTANGKLTYPVALITGDEINMAGITAGSNAQGWTTNGFTSMSPAMINEDSFQGANARMMDGQGKGGSSGNAHVASISSVYDYGSAADYDTAAAALGVSYTRIRPVLSLAGAYANYADGGTGTTTNPYIIE